MTIKELKETHGVILGVDFGDARTGLAVSDAGRSIALGRECIKAVGLENSAKLVAEYAKKEKVSAIVVGVPVNMDGTFGHRAERAKRFADTLEELTKLPVATIDERMTTMAASRFLNETDVRGSKRKAVIDTLSAEIILQNALDKLKNI